MCQRWPRFRILLPTMIMYACCQVNRFSEEAWTVFSTYSCGDNVSLTATFMRNFLMYMYVQYLLWFLVPLPTTYMYTCIAHSNVHIILRTCVCSRLGTTVVLPLACLYVWMWNRPGALHALVLCNWVLLKRRAFWTLMCIHCTVQSPIYISWHSLESSTQYTVVSIHGYDAA